MADIFSGDSSPFRVSSPGTNSPHRVFLVDDHTVVRMGLRRLFEETGSLSVIGEADSGKDALPQLLELSPDLALIDISLNGVEGMGGIELTRHMAVQCPNVPVLILSMHEDPYYVKKALEAGAGGYVLKNQIGESLVEAVETVLAGQRYLGEGMEAVERA